jgi:hypothetical protein
MCDFAPDNRGAEPLSRCGGWKLNAPGIAFDEFVILYRVASPSCQVCGIEELSLSGLGGKIGRRGDGRRQDEV